MRVLGYRGITRPVPWLLMLWLLLSLGHQQPWHRLSRLGMFLSYARKDFSCVYTRCGDNINCKYTFMFLLKNVARKGLLRCSWHGGLPPFLNKTQVFHSHVSQPQWRNCEMLVWIWISQDTHFMRFLMKVLDITMCIYSHANTLKSP